MIKIAHEGPLEIMAEIRQNTDYCYALVHLFETDQKYFNFFKESLYMGRKVLLDNSLFELGDAFDSEKYVTWINRLNPTEFIIPDSLGNTLKTIRLTEEFINNHLSHVNHSKAIGVVQGSTYNEMVYCYQQMESFHIPKSAFAFISEAYLTEFPHPNKYVSMSMGRVLILSRMLKDGIINTRKPHHLLGCMHPREFSFYTGQEFDWIDTIDTSSPVIHGIKNIQYSDAMGTWVKESTKVVDLLYVSLNKEQMECIRNNIKAFRKYVTP